MTCVGHKPGTLYGCASCEASCHCEGNFECLPCWDGGQWDAATNPDGSLAALLEASITVARARRRER